MASSQTTWTTREDFRKKKELEEARKAGTAAPELDVEGKEINPHIPQYISQAPWYLNPEGPGLKHQRLEPKEDTRRIDEWYSRGARLGSKPTRFRKGACTNCGAMSHNVKTCVERPRKVGARWTGKDLQADEVVQTVDLDFEGKHDRWNGYNPNEYAKVIEQFDKVDQKRREMKQAEVAVALQSGQKLGNDSDESDPESGVAPDDGFKEDDKANMMSVQDPRTRATIRNLRIREDTAKYLRNLDLKSAHYDPKTRSMRDNPTPSDNPHEQLYAGDNFLRATGDIKGFNEQQMYEFEAFEKGQELHVNAAPSQASLLFREFRYKKEKLKARTSEDVLARYGDQSAMHAPKELLFAQSESYVEYKPDGTLAKGHADHVVPKTKYPEDELLNNHTAVWGSHWENFRWGFACCHSTVKNSVCTGEAGKQARQSAAQLLASIPERKSLLEEAESVSKAEQARRQQEREKEETRAREKRFERALAAEDKLRRTEIEHDDRKRSYNSMEASEFTGTEEEMEAYNLKRVRHDDPMKDFLGKE